MFNIVRIRAGLAGCRNSNTSCGLPIRIKLNKRNK
jgi:hypothetical protein